MATGFASGKHSSRDTVRPGKFKSSLWLHPEILEQKLVWRRDPAERDGASGNWILLRAGRTGTRDRQPAAPAASAVSSVEHLLSFACVFFSWGVALETENVPNWK